jgi:hypothetical protein
LFVFSFSNGGEENDNKIESIKKTTDNKVQFFSLKDILIYIHNNKHVKLILILNRCTNKLSNGVNQDTHNASGD